MAFMDEAKEQPMFDQLKSTLAGALKPLPVIDGMVPSSRLVAAVLIFVAGEMLALDPNDIDVAEICDYLNGRINIKPRTRRRRKRR